eukprot:790073_1
MPTNANEQTHLVQASDVLRSSTKLTPPSFVVATSFTHELWLLFLRCALISLQILSQLGVIVVAIIFVGQLPNSVMVLAGVGFSRTFVNVTGTGMSWGFTTSLFTLLPQSIGAGHINHAAIHIQRAFYIVTIVSALLSISQFYAGEIMVAIGQPAELKPIVETYCRLLIPYIFICSYDAILVRLIQALDMNISLAICAVLMFASCPLITWFLMYYLDYGWQGTAIAQSVVMLLFFFIMLVLLIYKGYGFIFIPLPFTTVWSLKGIYNYLALALPGLCQNMFEFIIQEAAIVLSGYVASPTTALSATVILNNLFLVVISFSLATCSATNIRVGKYIGKGSIIYAKRAAVGGLMIAALIMSIGSLVLMCGVHVLPRIYTDNVDTIRLTSKIMWILVVFSCGCLMLQTLGGIYRGLGLQKIAAIVVSVSYTLIALPCSIVLLFSFDMRRDLVYGTAIIWGGLAFGNVLGAIVEIIYLWCFGDWKAAVRHANMRIKHTIKEYQSTKRFISVDR